jgi:hypothetical protein
VEFLVTLSEKTESSKALAKTTVLEKFEVHNGEEESGKHLVKAMSRKIKRIN